MRLYTGIDLHSSNSYLAIIDENGKRVFKKNCPTGSYFGPRLYKMQLSEESTYNWLVSVDSGRGI